MLSSDDYLPGIPEEQVLGDVRGRQCDAEGEVDDENVFEERPLADPDQGLGAVHVEIPLRRRFNSKALEFVRRNLRKYDLKCYSMPNGQLQHLKVRFSGT